MAKTKSAKDLTKITDEIGNAGAPHCKIVDICLQKYCQSSWNDGKNSEDFTLIPNVSLLDASENMT
jgi:hypothetical protein